MTTTSSCCAPSGPLGLGPGNPDPASPHGPDTNGVPWPGSAIPGAGAGRSRRQKVIPSGSFQMGDQHDEGYPADGEVPVHEVRIDSFRMDETAVTNAQFATFCKDTGYVTEAEQIGVSAVFHLAVDAAEADVMHQLAETPWWVAVKGANWRHPGGPRSSITDLQNHPVVHVSWNDAMAYCLWSGTRLPTEAEWEYASRGGLQSARFPWGDELTPRGRWNLNVWQGRFPTHNSVEDGYLTTAPVRTFRPNDFGLYQMVGNVWEWCADRFDPGYYAVSGSDNPQGPAADELSELAPGRAHGSDDWRVMRGGSYLCHDSYCYRYRVAARSSNTADSASANLGFRCVRDL